MILTVRMWTSAVPMSPALRMPSVRTQTAATLALVTQDGPAMESTAMVSDSYLLM